jgi:hypothetical protein
MRSVLWLFMLTAGCVSTPSAQSAPRKQISIDIDHHRAISPQWDAQLIDCSDSQFQCFEAPGRFLMAFPKACPTTIWDWSVAGYPFRNTAPAVHYGLPSGGYVSYKYPNVHLSYRVGIGFRLLTVRSNAVIDRDWGEVVEEYEIKYTGANVPFLCH